MKKIKDAMRGICIASILFWLVSIILNISIAIESLILGVIIGSVISIYTGEVIERKKLG